MGCVESLFPVAFFKLAATPTHIELYAFHRHFNHDHVNSFSSKKKKARRKKTIKKLVNINYS